MLTAVIVVLVNKRTFFTLGRPYTFECRETNTRAIEIGLSLGNSSVSHQVTAKNHMSLCRSTEAQLLPPAFFWWRAKIQNLCVESVWPRAFPPKTKQ
jgi:hypothetical protein